MNVKKIIISGILMTTGVELLDTHHKMPHCHEELTKNVIDNRPVMSASGTSESHYWTCAVFKDGNINQRYYCDCTEENILYEKKQCSKEGTYLMCYYKIN